MNLNDIVRNVDKMLRRLIGEDIEVLTVLAPNLGTVKVDPGQVDQILMNLVVNARDAMPGGGKLTIQTENVELDENYVRKHEYVNSGHYVLVAVSDSGTGMDPERLRPACSNLSSLPKNLGKVLVLACRWCMAL